MNIPDLREVGGVDNTASLHGAPLLPVLDLQVCDDCAQVGRVFRLAQQQRQVGSVVPPVDAVVQSQLVQVQLKTCRGIKYFITCPKAS